MIDGEPWFVALDAFPVLGYSTSGGAAPYVRHIDSTERRIVTRDTSLELFKGVNAPSLTALSESGLYKLVMRSDKPEAREFQNWVTREVLPSIQSAKDGSKTGAYVVGQAPIANQSNDPMASKGFIAKLVGVS